MSYFCVMRTEFLIVGQGICGTFLSWELQKAGKSFIIIDEDKTNTASKVASGVINPITGRRLVKTWMIDELLPFAFAAYTELGASIGIQCISQKDIIDFFPTPQMRLAFLERVASDPQYLSLPNDENDLQDLFNYSLGYGSIAPCYLVDLQMLLPAFRKQLEATSLLEEIFDISQLKIEEHQIAYKDIVADRIIFCDGRAGLDNPLFQKLPFALSKGEALIVNIPDLPRNNIFKKGTSIVPWQDDLFWVGSSYEWEFENDQPTDLFRDRISRQLKDVLQLPFTVVDHKAALRPGTLERRPFIGWHPMQPSVGIFNGMGTKGCSLAPFFAKQFVENIIREEPIISVADVKRFPKVLGR